MPDISALLNDPKTVWIAVAIMAYFLFFGKKPVAPPTPTPTPVDPVTPAPVVPVTPVERPLIDLLIKIVPVLLPILLKQQAKEEAAKAEAEQAK